MALPLRMRATVRRSASGGTDPDGHSVPATPEEHEIPCWLFHPAAHINASGELSNDSVNVVLNDLRLLVEYDADVTEQDQIHGVWTDDGVSVDDRLFKITFDRRRGDGRIGISHRALTLEAIT